MKESYEIRLPMFEGPFDLMLFFIERDELDIRDIPIARITEEFLRYLRSMEALNLEVASDFILFAATLMKIKARMLLPRPTLNGQGEEVDPREDLVRHLLEYKRFKDAAGQLADLEALALARYPRLNLVEEVQELADAAEENAQLVNLNLTSLTLAFQKVLAGYLDRGQDRQHVIVSIPYTIDEQKAQVSALVAMRGRVSFIDLLRTCADKLQMVYTFMAVLEMLNERTLNLIAGLEVGEEVNGFWVEGVSVNQFKTD